MGEYFLYGAEHYSRGAFLEFLTENEMEWYHNTEAVSLPKRSQSQARPPCPFHDILLMH